jgi:hypothetical protein
MGHMCPHLSHIIVNLTLVQDGAKNLSLNDKMKQVGTLGGRGGGGGLMLFWDGVESQAYECIKLNYNIYNVE